MADEETKERRALSDPINQTDMTRPTSATPERSQESAHGQIHAEVHLDPERLARWQGHVRSARKYDEEIIDRVTSTFEDGKVADVQLRPTKAYGGALVRAVLLRRVPLRAGPDVAEQEPLARSSAIYLLGRGRTYEIGTVEGAVYTVSVGVSQEASGDLRSESRWGRDRSNGTSYLHRRPETK